MTQSSAAGSSSPLIVSIMLNIGGEGGHAYSYNRAVGVAARLIDWEHRAAVQTGCTIEQLPPGWEVCLAPLHYRGARPQLLAFFRSSATIRRYLRKLVAVEQRPIIIFLEFFNFAHLAALALALVGVSRKNLSVWLVYRMDIHHQPTRRFYKLFNKLIRRLVGRRLALFTDSTRLAGPLSNYFHEPLTVLPIPHTGETDLVKLPAWAASADRTDKVIAWWPGRPAEEKGLTTIQHITQLTDEAARQLVLVVAEAAAVQPAPGGCTLMAIQTELPREEYLGWLHTTDLVLLPYNSTNYAERTSGIFIEAIICGKPPLVTAGTWMAGELQTANLSELIIEWNDPALLATMACLAHDAEVKRKVIQLQHSYRQQHGEQAYARVLREVFQVTCAN